MFAFSSKLPFLFSSLFKSIDPEDVEYKMGTRKPNPFAQRKRSKKLNRPGVADRRNEPYVEIVRENEYFCKYYQAQEICPIDEWQSLLSCLRSDLPTTFRITASKKEAVALSNIVQIKFFDEYCRALTELRNGSEMVEKPISLPWYPKGFAWQLQLSRRDIRRSEPLFKLHNFLIAETNAGNISRQEAVSMIPPIVLEVKPSDKVLDMCAAPGSKTSQLIEALHSANNNDIPSGFVLANDVDNNRCYMLVHQAKRLNSPSLLVTNHDSAFYPNLLQTDTEGRVSFLKFDKILCDVPCSGDGTLRKNPDIWLKWNTDQAYNLHGLQYRILRRGVELLAVGGRIVYSTCSMNPIENEAIIQRIIKDANGALEVIAVKQLLPGLKYVPGLKNWKVISKAGEIFSTMEEVPEKFQTIIRPNMFPLPENEIENIGLERCLRILPHLQNTGGFFVAALEKKQLLPWEKEETFPTIQIQQISGAPARKKCRTQGYKEDPFVFFKDSEDFWDSIQNFYELSDSFDKRCLLTRCIAGKKKNIYVCSNVIRDIIENNEKNVKIVNTGVKTFVRCDNKHMKCAFRLAQEGLNTINAFIGQRRRITLCKEDLLKLLQCTNLTKPPSLTELSKEAQEQAVSLEVGSCVLHYNIDELIISLVGWRGSCSLRAYTDLNDTVHLLRLLDADVTMFETNKFKKDELGKIQSQ